MYQVDFNRPNSVLGSEYHYPTNYIRTTKYTLASFLPLNLFGQFRRMSNLYFLLAAVFSVAGDSTISPVSQIAPLIFVLAVTAVKDGLEDYQRYRADLTANLQPCFVVRDDARVQVRTMDLQAGDLVMLKKGEKVPADLLLLSTSFEDGNCFIETSELDGETSLKRRNALPETMTNVTVGLISALNGRIQCEAPNENLLKFEGRLLLDSNGSERVLPLNMSQLLLRGSYLRNTDFAFGVVVYAGVDSKIFKNLKQSGLKYSSMEKLLNKIVLCAFIFNMIILFVSVFFEVPTTKLLDQSVWYMPAATAIPTYGFQHYFASFMTYFILFSYTIPVSLFVVIEAVRVLQRQFMMWDDAMKCPRGRPMRVNNSNLNEDLGCVNYVFSDKTGTLTRNEMVLTQLCTGDRIHDTRRMRSATASSELQRDPHLKRLLRCILLCNNVMPVEVPVAQPTTGYDASSVPAPAPSASASKLPHIPPLFSKSGHVAKPVGSPPPGLAIADPTAAPDAAKVAYELDYESQSPDEIALLRGIRAHCILKQRKKSTVVVDEHSAEKEIVVLDMLEFTSDRKRMSVIVREPDDGIWVYTKGADNILFPRLESIAHQQGAAAAADTVSVAQVSKHLHAFSEDGLRTLVFAYKHLTDTQYAEFKRRYDDAARSLVNREERMEAAMDAVERDLTLLGCSAIEDRLQDRVPETIDFLLKCGIKVWMLTGDRQETAINIAHSCKLVRHDAQILRFTTQGTAEVLGQLQGHLNTIDNAPSSQFFALAVTGEALSVLFESAPGEFLRIAQRCTSVICCRVTPLQKALVVRLIKTELKVLTLSIGDGANDVSMIQEADIGVGIEGVEGAQAVRAADYAFVEFKSLARLLAVHGRYSLVRLVNLVLYSFYKNISFISTQFFYGPYNAWSGQALYNGSFLPNWNVLFTSLPPLLYAFTEKDSPESSLLRNPKLYQTTRDGGALWNWRIAFGWLGATAWHLIVSGIGNYLIFSDGAALNVNGTVPDLDTFQWFNAVTMLAIVTLRIMLMSKYWTWITIVGIALSFALYVLLMGGLEVLTIIDTTVGGARKNDDIPIGFTLQLNGIPAYWFTLFLSPIAAVLPDFIAAYLLTQESPTDVDVLREAAVVERRARRKGGARSESSLTGPVGAQARSGGDIVASVKQPESEFAAAARGSQDHQHPVRTLTRRAGPTATETDTHDASRRHSTASGSTPVLDRNGNPIAAQHDPPRPREAFHEHPLPGGTYEGSREADVS
ncbi:hypothetical protein BC828DRAFT_397693 [Blastocladiella britannica]|nr:hypothetical protein BC828DRAFT_397693 [Blastocladiella britannica]